LREIISETEDSILVFFVQIVECRIDDLSCIMGAFAAIIFHDLLFYHEFH
jgi:hypothetical protein